MARLASNTTLRPDWIMAALRDFVADLMERHGAATAPLDPDGLEVMAPPVVQAVFGWPELVRLGFGTELPSGAQRIGLEGDWLERFSTLLGDRGRVAERQITLPWPLPVPGDPERVLEHTLDLPNAIWRFQKQTTTWSQCAVLCFRTSALSDEKRDILFWLGINTGTGAVLGDVLPRLRAILADGTLPWQPPEPTVRQTAGCAWSMQELEARVRSLLNETVRAELAPFLRAMNRRLMRDHTRLHRYHDDLRRESLKRLAGAVGIETDKATSERRREELKIAAVEHEYRAKLEDLRHNYALRVTTEWVQTLVVFVPVQRFDVLIRRRKGERVIHLDWHPTVRLSERPLCEWGLGTAGTRLVCDDNLHLTDPAGQAPCPVCNKPYCRACHPAACPRCG